MAAANRAQLLRLALSLTVAALLHQPCTAQMLWSPLRTSRCNDGSPAGFYYRPGSGSVCARGLRSLRRAFPVLTLLFRAAPSPLPMQGARSWVVWLQGGWYCFDANTCEQRWLLQPSLMSSTNYSHTKTNSGILSLNPIGLWPRSTFCSAARVRYTHAKVDRYLQRIRSSGIGTLWRCPIAALTYGQEPRTLRKRIHGFSMGARSCAK
jgi:hypothetical protein